MLFATCVPNLLVASVYETYKMSSSGLRGYQSLDPRVAVRLLEQIVRVGEVLRLIGGA